MKARKHPTQEFLNDRFTYRDGHLYNKNHVCNRSLKGDRVGCINKTTGYWRVGIKGEDYRLNRLIWIMHYGKIPEGLHVDHINQKSSDNRIENLRLVTNQENMFNTKAKGYYFDKSREKYRSQIKLNGKRKFLGSYKTKKQAHQAYLDAKKELHVIKDK